MPVYLWRSRGMAHLSLIRRRRTTTRKKTMALRTSNLMKLHRSTWRRNKAITDQTTEDLTRKNTTTPRTSNPLKLQRSTWTRSKVTHVSKEVHQQNLPQTAVKKGFGGHQQTTKGRRLLMKIFIRSCEILWQEICTRSFLHCQESCMQ